MIYILMGVSGAGKTLIGQKLSECLDIPFYDGDDFHPPANVKKMKSGQPLNDNDRRPWLESLANNMIEWEQTGGAILACSALKKKYRKILGSKTDTQFIYLKGSPSLIADRLAKRKGHYMPPELLQSQFDALEEPDEAFTVSVEPSPEEIVTSILDRLAD
jgi:carbohydrate kinase (thermoresistant glucokinase family)